MVGWCLGGLLRSFNGTGTSGLNIFEKIDIFPQRLLERFNDKVLKGLKIKMEWWDTHLRCCHTLLSSPNQEFIKYQNSFLVKEVGRTRKIIRPILQYIIISDFTLSFTVIFILLRFIFASSGLLTS